MNLTVYFDGACEPSNPGGVSTWAFVVHEGDPAADPRNAPRPLARFCGVMHDGGPLSTNNAAEYCAIGKSLRWLLDWKAGNTLTTVLFRGDSKLVVEQIGGNWQVKSETLAKYHARCMELIKQLDVPVTLEWVPREGNREADRLSNHAYHYFVRTRAAGPHDLTLRDSLY